MTQEQIAQLNTAFIAALPARCMELWQVVEEKKDQHHAATAACDNSRCLWNSKSYAKLLTARDNAWGAYREALDNYTQAAEPYLNIRKALLGRRPMLCFGFLRGCRVNGN